MNTHFLPVASLEELQRRGVIVVRGADRPIAVFAEGGQVAAVDNRCPHMGFPLSRGLVQDGILTCPWHNARFDLASGCAFDLFADDTPAYDVEIREGDVFVSPTPRQGDPVARHRGQLARGMEQNIGLVQAKGVVGLLKAGVDSREIVWQTALFGVKNRDGWNGSGGAMTCLTALANLAPHVGEETAFLALFQGAARVANDCAGQPPRRERYPLESADLPLETLKRWLVQWTHVRQRDAAERTLLTAIHQGASPAALCDLLFTAATERFYADGGHVLDECNKAAELLDLIGWEHATDVLPTVVGHITAARGGEEISHWRQPIDVVPALQQAGADLPALLREGKGKAWDGVSALADTLLGDDPLTIVAALRDVLADGARPEQLSGALALAAALRVARFGPSNEMGDWVTVLHTFTYCHALHQAVKRCPAPAVLRGVFHGAMSVYFDRFLNVPPARLPGERETLDTEPEDAQALLAQFLDALDSRHTVPVAARAVARYLALGHPLPPLLDALTLATVREDADFHTIQMLEAGIGQFREWEGRPEGAYILVAVARYLAAHAPTQRARLQTARIALRLHRGDSLYSETGDDSDAP